MVHFTDSFPGRIIESNGITYTYFGGTAYLGLQNHEQFQHLFIENVQRYGTNYGASRKSNVRFAIYEEAEKSLAKLVGSESCLTVSSGFLAGQFLARFLKNKNYKLFYAPNTHSALFTKKNKNHESYAALLKAVIKHLDSDNPAPPVVLLDSIDFSGLHYPNFEFLKSLPLSEIILVIDDSHGIGVVGEDGNGVFKDIQKLQPKGCYMCSSLGKGFGIQAGAVFGTESDIATFKNTPFFGGASPACPAAIATFLDAQTIYKAQRVVLKKHLNEFLQKTKQLSGFTYMEGHPTFSYQNQRLTDFLFRHNIIVTNFNYPNDGAAMMSRIVLSAGHTKKDISNLTELLNKFY